jgi:hypothetical protein
MGDVRPNRWRPNLTDGVLLLFCFQQPRAPPWAFVAAAFQAWGLRSDAERFGLGERADGWDADFGGRVVA